MKHTQVNHKKAALLGLQHLLAMYSGAIAVPLLIGTALKFNSTQMTYLVSIDIFMCGLATALQLLRNRYFGIGLPVVLLFFTSKNRLFDMLEKFGVLLGQNGVLFYQKGVSRK